MRAAVVGCGNISKFHFSGLEKAGVEIAWVCDINEDNAEPWKNKYNAKYASDYREIIKDDKVDIVVLTLISSFHQQMCLDAINAGKAVICEKTLTENSSDSAKIVKLAQEQNTILFTSYMKRFIPAVQKAKDILPDLGKILNMNIRGYQHWGNLWEGVPNEGFFHKPIDGPSPLVNSYGGGILVCGGSHLLDLVLFFMGRPHRVCSSLHIPEGADYDIQAAALMETDNGIVHYEALAHPLNRIGFLKDGWDERVEINGTNGRLDVYSSMWDDVDHKASMLIHYDNATGRSTEYRYAPVSPFDRAIQFFCGNIENKTQGSQSRLTGYEVDELIDHIKLSSESKKAIDIQWKI